MRGNKMPKSAKSTQTQTQTQTQNIKDSIEECLTVGPVTIQYLKKLRKKKFKYERYMELVRSGVTPRAQLKHFNIDVSIKQYNSKLKSKDSVDLSAFDVLKPAITQYDCRLRQFSIALKFDKETQSLVPQSGIGGSTRSTSSNLSEQFESLIFSRVKKEDFNLAQLDLLLVFIRKIFNAPESRARRQLQSQQRSSGNGCAR
jgi:hypothetical protein